MPKTLIAPEPLPHVAIDNDFYWDSVLAGMHDVLQSETGTARAVGLGAPYEMAGKSGTAQVFSVSQDEEYDEEEIEECFLEALAVSRRQGTVALELRAAISLSRLRRAQDKARQARALLAEVYGKFDEGFDTADLKEAKELLDELG